MTQAINLHTVFQILFMWTTIALFTTLLYHNNPSLQASIMQHCKYSKKFVLEISNMCNKLKYSSK